MEQEDWAARLELSGAYWRYLDDGGISKVEFS